MKWIKKRIQYYYFLFTRRNYYISGTGRKGNRREYFRFIFATQGFRLPVTAIENYAAKQYELLDVVIISVIRLPNKMAETADKKNFNLIKR